MRRYGYNPSDVQTTAGNGFKFAVGQRVRRTLSGLTGLACHPADVFEGVVVTQIDTASVTGFWPVYLIRDDHGNEKTFGETVLVAA